MTVHTKRGRYLDELVAGEITFPAPVFVGDTLFAETGFVSLRPSESRPGQGVVVFEHRGRNQSGVLVCRARRSALVLTAASGEARNSMEA
jgi:acyl dehydratase